MPAQETPPNTVTLAIAAIGGMGDGIAYDQNRTVFIPYTAVGDVVEARLEAAGGGVYRGQVIRLITPGAGRTTPVCQHFGVCGGCTTQHLTPQAYRQFKLNIVQEMLKRLTAEDCQLGALVAVGLNGRRRVEFKVSVHKGTVSVGFFEPRSHKIVDVAMCPVTQDNLVALLPGLRLMLTTLKKPGNIKAIHATALNDMVDMVISAAQSLSAQDVQVLIEYAQNAPISRLTLQLSDQDNAIIYAAQPVILPLAGVAVELPAGAFLQASAIGQQAITEFVARYLSGCKQVADIYSGCGTYGLPLAQSGIRVFAYEGSDDMILALQNAIRRAKLDVLMSARTRDLMTKPLTVQELQHFDGVVINPPRNGAEPQAKLLAKSNVAKIVMVSCNPATFERDAQHLLRSGYRLESLVPIDQFYYSSHLEVVAGFVKS